jgi:hypothetical protein
MRLIRKSALYRVSVLLFLLALPVGLLAAPGGAAARTAAQTSARTAAVTTSSLGEGSPTFVGSAATGCSSPGCSLLSGPTFVPSTASAGPATGTGTAAASRQATASAAGTPGQARALPDPTAPGRAKPGRALPDSSPSKDATVPAQPSVRCAQSGSGCDQITSSPLGASGVKGINAVDSASQSGNVLQQDIEPSDQGLCAGNGYVVEDDNIGEILIFNTALHRQSPVISLDTVMGLTAKGWSSGGDISCLYDRGNGGHWFFTEFASASTEASGGPFSGCFNAVASTCYEAIAVTVGSNPFGPYRVYYVNANYNPAEPGYPFLLNDFTKISVTRDAFLLFYDEFPLSGSAPGIGGGGFNGAQEFAFDKTALERGLPVTLSSGKPNQAFNVAIENMGLLPTPNGTCASDDQFSQPGITCWFSVIPALPPDPSQFDNSHGGSGFMLDTLDFYGQGDNRVAVFDWTGLGNLGSSGCASCGGVRFGGQLFSGTQSYNDLGLNAPQKAGPIPLGDECGAAGYSTGSPPPASCPEGPIATNGDNFTQASQAQGQLWGAISTQVSQKFTAQGSPQTHIGAAYWVIGTRSFDSGGALSLTSQAYVSPAHEELEFPDIAASDNGLAIMFFTVSGDGGPTGADNGGFFPSTGYGRLTSTSGGLLGSTISIVDLGQAPQDGFSEYDGFPGPLGERWGDYSAGVYDPGSGKVYFSTGYIQYPNCTGSAFTLTIGTCGGTRDGRANWGTSVNSVSP